jgi:hypothetical protein|tara:strand:- start:520 stop:1452 length:933 start_codon:yes stop_codon:yes gene_type:complete
MRKIYTFDDFLLEAEEQDQLKKICIAVSVEMPDNKYIYDTKYNVSKLFELLDKNEKAEVAEIPVLNYANWKIEKMINDGWDSKFIYNSIKAKQKVSSKVKWCKQHEESNHTPKVVFDKDNLKELSFPIIAKPDNRYSGQGIVVFKEESDFEDVDLDQFAVFSDKINIVDELRIYCWKGKPLMLVYRVPANEETKNLSKKASDKLVFNYELSKSPITDNLVGVVEEFSKGHEDLDFYSIDIVIDDKEHPYVIEMSSEPGPVFGVMGHVYKEMYKDYYGEEISAKTNKIIDTYIEEDINTTIASDKSRFKRR